MCLWTVYVKVREDDERTLSFAVGNDNTVYDTMTPSAPIETQLAHFFSSPLAFLKYCHTHTHPRS